MDLLICGENIVGDLMGEVGLVKGKGRDKKKGKGYMINWIKGKVNEKK